MTEDDAKAKTCHQTLASLGGSDGVPSWQSPQACIGSECMAWRWHNPKISNGDSIWEHNTQGFCGLAGKP